MCGIAGIIQLNPAGYTQADSEKMANALAHRGPDGQAYWQNENNTVLFSHRRLAIIDLNANAAQPMHYNNRYTIVHNGEIYNYIELKDELQKKGYQFLTSSDTEVILAAYQEYKENCIQFFEGMFAFVIWDEKEKELFACRDRFGEKPFFYYTDEKRKVFLFGSEIKALWAAGVKKEMNLKMLFNFLTIGYTDNPNNPDETFYEGISKLPAAHFLKLKLNEGFEISIENYWDIDLSVKNKSISDKEAIERFSELLTSSVKKRFRSDVPAGTSLSGGLDSSSIVAISSLINSNSDSHKCFTAVFPGFENDETLFSQKVAAQFKREHFTTSPSSNDLINDFQKLIYHQEEPFGSSSIYAQYKVYELAKSAGIKVVLDGQGADETLAGYHKYYKWYWQELFRHRKLMRSGEIAAAKKSGVAEKFEFRNIIASIFPDLASVVLEQRYLLHALQQEDLNKDFIQLQSKEAYYSTPTIFTLNGILYFNTIIHGLEELLRYADRNSMAHGLEVRLPFLDHKLVEFIFSLPPSFKIREGWTKWILRKTIDPVLPADITWRNKKVGFETPQKNWMQEKPIQDMIFESKQRLVANKILKPEVVNKPVIPQTVHEAGNFDWRYLVAAQYI